MCERAYFKNVSKYILQFLIFAKLQVKKWNIIVASVCIYLFRVVQICSLTFKCHSLFFSMFKSYTDGKHWKLKNTSDLCICKIGALFTSNDLEKERKKWNEIWRKGLLPMWVTMVKISPPIEFCNEAALIILEFFPRKFIR